MARETILIDNCAWDLLEGRGVVLVDECGEDLQFTVSDLGLIEIPAGSHLSEDTLSELVSSRERNWQP